VLALLAAGEADSDEVRAGVDYLVATQQPDGNWQEDQFTGTGFPKVFYLKYHMYSLYFPLMALGRYAAARGQQRILPFAAAGANGAGHSHLGRNGQTGTKGGYYTEDRQRSAERTLTLEQRPGTQEQE
jgi:squalene-hopene/tetraprenyl-beta-curcumene cyclase